MIHLQYELPPILPAFEARTLSKSHFIGSMAWSGWVFEGIDGPPSLQQNIQELEPEHPENTSDLVYLHPGRLTWNLKMMVWKMILGDF